MKTQITTQLFLGAMYVALSALPALAAPAPPVMISAEPMENGRLVYLPLPPETGADPRTQLFGMRLEITNNDTVEHLLSLIRLTFTYSPGNTGVELVLPSKTIGAGATGGLYLDPEDAIRLEDPAPARVRLELFFDGLLNDPAIVEYDLAPYRAPTPSGSYLFPGNAADLSDDQYWSYSGMHTGDSQFFAHDFTIYGWDRAKRDYSTLKPGTDGTRNDHSLGWGMPVYAMADGVVLWARTDWENNPAPYTRVIQRTGADPGEAISAVSVTGMSASRVAAAVRDSSSNLRIIVWDIADDGFEITRKGMGLSGPSQQIAAGPIAIDALDESRLVTASRTVLGVMRLGLWDVSSDGLSVTESGHLDVEQVQEMSFVPLGSAGLATVTTSPDGSLHLTVWRVSDTEPIFSSLAEDFAEDASSVSVVRLDVTRLAVTMRNSQGRLKVIVWDVLANDGMTSFTLQRRGEHTADSITRATAVATDTNRMVTAVRTAAGNVKLLRWNVSDDGQTVTHDFEIEGEPIQDLAAAQAFPGDEPDTLITSVITQQGNLRNILWTTRGAKLEEGTALERWGERDDGAVTAVSLEEYGVGKGRMAGAVRTASGDLELITWRVGSGGGNGFRILHGNCRAVYAHFQAGTMNPEVAYPGAAVKAGQLLARMGNSGQSTGPHTHIHAERVDESFGVEQIISAEAAGLKDHILTYRPLPFHCAVAMRRDAIELGGPGNPNNSFSDMEGHGMYFADFGVRPRWLKEVYVDGTSRCSFPSGHKNCVGNFAGPYHTVNAALNNSCWGHELFIRVGTYNESVLFNRGMTVRSYDGTAVIGAP